MTVVPALMLATSQNDYVLRDKIVTNLGSGLPELYLAWHAYICEVGH